MIVEANNSYCRVIHSADGELRWLGGYLASSEGGRRGPGQTGKTQLFNIVTDSFPSGFLATVQRAAADEKISFQVLDKRTMHVPFDTNADIVWLRDYQAAAIDVSKTEHRGVFHHATGAGKTELIVALTLVRPCTWLILTHRKQLMADIGDRYKLRTGEDVGFIGEGVLDISKRVTVATFQSVEHMCRKSKRVRAFVESVQALAVDEVHITGASMFWRRVQGCTNAYFRYGFSGTPFDRTDAKSVFVWAAMGPIIHRIAAKKLIDEGVLAKPTIHMIPYQHPTPKERTWKNVYAAHIVKSPARNALLKKACTVATKPALLFVRDISHGKALERELRAEGHYVEFVWGKHDVAVRRAAIRRLVHGDSDVLITSTIFQEGIDIPELQSVIIGAGGKSVIAALQSLGRGMRRRDSQGNVTKAEFSVYDINDQGCGCRGTKHNACEWMERHTKGRMRAYQSEKYDIIDAAGLAAKP